MSELQFAVTGADAKRHTAIPTIVFHLRIRHRERIEAIVLRTQIRIEPQWRPYDEGEKTLLGDLFGTPDRWDTTLRALSWADVPVMVPAFEDETSVEVNVPCTYDFDVTATRYFSALNNGDIPLRFLFSGSIFRHSENAFSTEMVPWSSECAYRLPFEVWRSAMNACYGNSVAILIDRETFDQLHRRRIETSATSWDDIVR